MHIFSVFETHLACRFESIKDKERLNNQIFNVYTPSVSEVRVIRTEASRNRVPAVDHIRLINQLNRIKNYKNKLLLRNVFVLLNPVNLFF